MKIVAISASPRGVQSLTLRLVRAVARGAAEAGAEVETVDICKLNIRYCTACGVCHAKGICVHHDDFADLYRRILTADGLIMGSPNYLRSITGQLKILLDRMSSAIHCQLLSSKYVCAVGTAGGPGYTEVTDYLTSLLVSFGAYSVGSVGAADMSPDALAAVEADAVALGRTLVEAIRSQRVYPEQVAVHTERRAFFRGLVQHHPEEWAYECTFWQEQGEA